MGSVEKRVNYTDKKEGAENREEGDVIGKSMRR